MLKRRLFGGAGKSYSLRWWGEWLVLFMRLREGGREGRMMYVLCVLFGRSAGGSGGRG